MDDGRKRKTTGDDNIGWRTTEDDRGRPRTRTTRTTEGNDEGHDKDDGDYNEVDNDDRRRPRTIDNDRPRR